MLLFSRTIGYRHDAIETGRPVLTEALADRLVVDATEDPGAFTPDNLAHYRAVIFFYTQGDDLLDATGKAAFEAFIRGGGGWLGVHSAASTETQWSFYQGLLVAPFVDHPAIQPAAMTFDTQPPTIVVTSDEWYNFATNPRATGGVHVHATIDEATYTGGTMGLDHPMIWSHELFGGRALFSQPGHVPERWTDPAFVAREAAAVLWVAGLDD